MIREATPADLYKIQRIAEDAFAPYVETIGVKPAPMVANFAEQIDKGLIEVLVKSTGIQGYCVSYPRGARWHIENVAVASGLQGAGVGTALIADVEKRATMLGFQAVDLYTNAQMTGALGWYAHLGYTETHRGKEDGFDRVFFEKALR